ncbi:hypothetical protein Tco_0071155 [Tanacetum coccineum]
MTEAKGDGGEGFMEGETGRKGYKGMISIVYDSVDVIMAMSVEELLDWIMDSGGSYHITYKRDYLVDFEEYDGGNKLLGDGRECRIRGTGKVQVHMRDGSSFVLDNVRGSLVVLSGTRRANCVYTLDGQVVIREILKGRKQLGEYQTGWKITTGNVLDSYNQRNMGFNESGEYKKTFIGSGVGTGSVQVLQGVEFEVEPQEDHTFEVEPHGNVDHVAVAEAEKIYAHESLTFNNTVACEVISKWKAGLKDDMDARSDVTEIWPTKGLLDRANGMYMVWRSSGSEWNTLWVTQSSYTGSWYRLCWKDTLYCLLREYQMVCTRLDIASADVDQVPWVDHHKLRVDDNKYVEEARSYDAAHDGLSLQLKRGALSKDIPVAKVQHR